MCVMGDGKLVEVVKGSSAKLSYDGIGLWRGWCLRESVLCVLGEGLRNAWRLLKKVLQSATSYSLLYCMEGWVRMQGTCDKREKIERWLRDMVQSYPTSFKLLYCMEEWEDV